MANKTGKRKPARGKPDLVGQVHAMTDHFKSLPLAEAAAAQTVSFRCSNPSVVLVTISTSAGAFLLNQPRSVDLPAGTNNIVWAARGAGGAAFQVVVTGGRLNLPIQGPLHPSGKDGGPRVVTVP